MCISDSVIDFFFFFFASRMLVFEVESEDYLYWSHLRYFFAFQSPIMKRSCRSS